MLTASAMYYLQDMKMEAIAARLHLSRSSVSRLLKAAREEGLVNISLRPMPTKAPEVASQLRSIFDITPHVVSVPDSATPDERLDHVAMTTARLIGGWFDSGMILGIAWGTTTTAVATHLGRKPTRSSSVVQLNGSANLRSYGGEFVSEMLVKFGSAFDAQVHLFPVPAFFDFPESRTAMWRERSVSQVLDLQRRADIALFGIGALSAEVPSHVYSAGYLDTNDMRSLEGEGVVGDVCTVFLRADGTWDDLELNARATGPTPTELRQIRRRVCAVAGERKIPPLIAALRAGLVTDLVIDEVTALALLERLLD